MSPRVESCGVSYLNHMQTVRGKSDDPFDAGMVCIILLRLLSGWG